MRKRILVSVLSIACVAACCPAAGDVFKLSTDGQVGGKLLNPDEKPRRTYVVQTANGSIITLAADQVREVTRRTPVKDAYDELRTTTPDTIEGHWKVANWCRENKLLRERKDHLRRILELAPDDAEARRLLGYRRVEGQWMLRAEEMRSRGFVEHQGEWRTPQDAAIRTRQKQIEDAEDSWRKKVRRWRSWLGRRNGDRVDEAGEGLLSADDRHAAPALLAVLKKEKVPEIRLLLLEALSDNPHSAAVDAIAERVIKDPSPDVRRNCVDYLVAKHDPYLTRRFVEALASNENVEVNRAAAALGALGFEDAVLPLIDALITKHKIANPNAGRTTAVRGRGLSMGGPKYHTVELKNQAVRTALVRLSGGQSFEFDKQAWRRWYTASRREASVDMRRD